MALIETGDDISSIKLIYIFNLVGSLIYPMLVMGALVAYEKKAKPQIGYNRIICFK